jgi:hypothetical protein
MRQPRWYSPAVVAWLGIASTASGVFLTFGLGGSLIALGVLTFAFGVACAD